MAQNKTFCRLDSEINTASVSFIVSNGTPFSFITTLGLHGEGMGPFSTKFCGREAWLEISWHNHSFQLGTSVDWPCCRKNPKNWDTRKSCSNRPKIPTMYCKNSDIRKICCNHPKIWTRSIYRRVIRSKDEEGITNSVDPDLIWVYTVCPNLSVWKLRIITVALP